MATVVRMPSVLAGATEAVIARWLVAAGDAVSVGTPVAEIETEKALVEYAAEEAGIVGRLVLAEGGAGQIGDPILVLAAADEDAAAIDAALGMTPSRAVAARAPAEANPAPPPAPRPRIFASPLVRKIAGEKGIDLTAIEGTGPNGRIVRRDLDGLAAAAAAGAPAAGPAAAPIPARGLPGDGRPANAVTGESPGLAREGPAAGRLIPHTPMRRAIARRLTEAVASTPHFDMVTECVADELLALRERVNATASARVSVNDFVVMAAAGAFGDVPEANVTWREAGLFAHGNVDISIAVATDGGLVTPVLRDVAGKRLTQVAREARDLVEGARERRLLPR
jgi:pyruvate dehydrogenase E2 component (dihydrolipoamide acetyltransferase)